MKTIIPILIILGLAKWWFTDPSISVPTNDISFDYIVKYSGNAGRSDPLPMIIALHGNGDTTKNFYETALDQINPRARIILIEGPISHGRGSSWPWSGADFSQYGVAFKEAAELLAIEYPTIGKPLLLGYSGGGMMAYYQSVKHGDSYSYIFPISGQITEEHLGDNTVNSGAKVYAYHGKNDRVVSANAGRKAVDLLRLKNVRVKFVEFDGGHHGIFKEAKRDIFGSIGNTEGVGTQKGSGNTEGVSPRNLTRIS